MATANINEQCSMCNDNNDTYYCKGCKKSFCITHLLEHREKVKQDFHEIEHNYNLFQQNIIDQKTHTNQHSLINKINQWENNAIEKIKQTAEECRHRLIKYLNKYIIEIENKLKDLFDQLRKTNKENRYNEIELEEFKQKLNRLQDEFDKPRNISVEKEKASSFINKICVIMPVGKDTKWKQKAITIAGGNGHGNQVSQLSRSWGFCIDDDKTIYIADCENHRIIEWKPNATHGRILAGGKGAGSQINQLNDPADVIIDKKSNSLIISDYGNRRVLKWSLEENRNNAQVIVSNIQCFGLAIDKNGDMYVSDEEKHEVRRWKRGEKEGRIVAGGNGKGDRLSQLYNPRFIFVDDDLSLYVSDCSNLRVMKWVKDTKEGIIVAGGNGEGNSLTQLFFPHGVIVDQLRRVYVADNNNDRIMRWCEGERQGTIVVGGNERGNQTNQLYCPNSLLFDQQGNLYVSDQWNHRIQKFEID